MFLHHLGIQPPVADMLGIFGAIKILLGQVDVVMGLHGVACIYLLLNLLGTVRISESTLEAILLPYLDSSVQS